MVSFVIVESALQAQEKKTSHTKSLPKHNLIKSQCNASYVVV